MSSRAQPPPPIFVLGVHRSGTTWLSHLLAGRGRCSLYTVRHLLSAVDDHPHTPQSAVARLREAGVTTRPGDGLVVHADASEEYGYLLAHRHGSSRTTRHSRATLQAAVAQLHYERPGHAPVLRNPWDYAATHKLAKWFPRARFVFLHRTPVATVGSAVEMFQDFWTRPHPYGLLMSRRYERAWASWWQRPLLQAVARRPHIVARIVASGTALAHSAHLTDAARLEPHRQVHLRYADLLADPVKETDRICAELNVAVTGPPPSPARPRDVPSRPWLIRLQTSILQRNRHYCRVRALTDHMD